MSELRAGGSDLLRPYVPRLLIQWIEETPAAVYREVPGSIVFVDISGFTKLSEKLAKRGKVGAEELTDTIGACFARLLAVAYGNGGGLIKFGGDALLLLFTGEDHEAKACRAAVGMRRTLREIGRIETEGGRVTLRMSVGVHSGTFLFFLVGDSHRELIVTGPAASRTVEMEGTAEAGEILVSASTASTLPESVLGHAKGAGRLLRREPPGLAVERAAEPVASGVDLFGYVPIAVREHVLAGGAEPEHRRVPVAFVHFDGVEAFLEREGPSALAEGLAGLVRDVQAAVDAQELTFLGTDIDEDGGKIILVAGAPRSTGEDDERLLRALRQIVDRERAIPIRVGVNRGPVFAGDIGPTYRRTYTVMGDTVNLAARLMAAAKPGQILATEGVLERSRTAFETVALEPFHVKGKAKPVQAFSLGAVREGAGPPPGERRMPLVGREVEVAAMEAALEAARARRGGVIELIGEPGIGKSRLIEELKERAAGLRVASAACDAYESQTPYHPFRGVLRELLGIGDADEPAAATERLRERVDVNAPELDPWLPLLGIALDLELPPTPEVEALDPQFLRERLAQVTVSLLDVVLPTPTLFVFEDVHWMDGASSDLLRHLAAAALERPWLVCATRRDVDTGFVAPEAPGTVALRPAPLGADAAKALLGAETEDAPLPPHVMATLAERAGGNPLFLKELVAAARSAGGVDDLPDSVEAVITAQIDRLRPPDRALLRAASVLGASFPPDLLDALLAAEDVRPDEVQWNRLAEFVALDRGAFRFQHALIRDAAYEGLPYRRRRDLHARVGEAIERSAGPSADEQAELLSLHFFHAQRYEPAWRYSRVAGERAQTKYANVEAASFYERALEAARRLDVPAPERAGVLEALGDVRYRVGTFEPAAHAYASARRLLADDALAQAKLLQKEAWIPERLGRYPQALRCLSRGFRLLDSTDGGPAASGRARLAGAYAAIRQGQGKSADAIRWCRRAIDDARTAGERDVLADAYFILDWALVDLGRLDEAVYSRQALAIFEELGDLAGQAVVLNNLGGFAYYEGRWDEAMELYERGRDARLKTGDEVEAAAGMCNRAEILLDQGRVDEAEDLCRETLRVWRAADYRWGIAFVTCLLGRAAARERRFDEALRLLDAAGTGFEEIGSEGDLLEAKTRAAESVLLSGDAERALSLADNAITPHEAMGGAGPQGPMLHRIRGEALMLTGRQELAREALERSLEDARSRGAEYEVALSIDGMCRLARARAEPVDVVLEAEARAIFDRLGVVDPPRAPQPGPAVTRIG